MKAEAVIPEGKGQNSEAKAVALSRMRRCVRWLRKQWMGCAAGMVLAGGAGYVSALYFSAPLLRLANAETKADAMVVLGGETVFRPARALELYQQGAAPIVLISGEGDCEGVRNTLTGKGVPSEAIELECASRTTRENAKFSVPLLRARNVKRVILITSWFHSRRALHCFQHSAPEIEFISLPTIADLPAHHWPSKWERRWVLSEYAKLLYYWVRFGIAPV